MKLFAHPSFLLAIIPAMLAAGLLLWIGSALKKHVERTLFSAEVYQKLTASLRPVSRWRNVCLLAGIFFLFIALAGPQWGTEIVEVQGSFAQTIIAVDVSASMRAQDLQPNRLENAKMMLRMLVSNLKDERIGLIAFTSQAQIACPITTDQEALTYFISTLRPDMLPVPGTSLAAPVTLAARLLSKYPGQKAVILLTDGEDHSPKDLAAAKEAALKNNIRIIAIGIGTKEGTLLPDKVDASGQVIEYKKDRKGNTVISKLDDQSLVELSGENYIPYTTAAQVAVEVEKKLRSLDKTSTRVSRNLTYKNRYQIPLAFSFLLLTVYLLWPVGRKKQPILNPPPSR